MTRSAHAAIVAAKDAQLASLASEVAFLRRLFMPSLPNHNVSMEADAIIEGRQEQIAAAPAFSDPHQEEVANEASRILSGSY